MEFPMQVHDPHLHMDRQNSLPILIPEDGRVRPFYLAPVEHLSGGLAYCAFNAETFQYSFSMPLERLEILFANDDGPPVIDVLGLDRASVNHHSKLLVCWQRTPKGMMVQRATTLKEWMEAHEGHRPQYPTRLYERGGLILC